MRSAFPLLPILTALLGAAAIFACSSSDPEATPTPDAGTTRPDVEEEEEEEEEEGSSSGGTSSGGEDPDGGSSSGGGASSSSSGSSGNTFDGGGTIDGGATGGTKCLANSVIESEDNNTKANADVLEAKTISFCGRINAADDVDFAKMVRPAAGNFAIKWRYEYTGVQNTVQLEVLRESNDQPVSNDNFPEPGEAVIFKVSGKAGAAIPSDFVVMVTVN